MEPVTAMLGACAVVAVVAGWRLRTRAVQAEAETTRLRDELYAERYAAGHDPLTGLPNRRVFYQHGARLLADPAQAGCGLLLDLDDFKRVNDTLGHAAGDEVLVILASRLAEFAAGDLVARLGGDEFVAVLTGPRFRGIEPTQIAERLSRDLAAPIYVAGHLVSVTASIGVVPIHGRSRLADVLNRADAEMYEIKAGGGRMAWVAPLNAGQAAAGLDAVGPAVAGPIPTEPGNHAVRSIRPSRTGGPRHAARPPARVVPLRDSDRREPATEAAEPTAHRDRSVS